MKTPSSPSTRLIALSCAVYFTSYLTRKAYEASILAICDETGLDRTAAGLAGTATVALYGGGQFVTGLMADRFNPCRIVLAALLLTAACNLALPFAVGSVAALVALQAVNGFAQAMFWPPLVKILANSLSKERYNGAVFVVNVAANIAIIAIFALVAGCVRFAGWRLSFWIVAGMALAMAVAWGQLCSGGFWTRVLESANPESRIPSAKPETRNSNPNSAKSFPIAIAVLIPIALAIVCMGIMRDGIEVWAPSIISDLYGLSTSSSTASVVILPIFAVASMAAARALRRALGSEEKGALALYSLGLLCALVLLPVSRNPDASGQAGAVAHASIITGLPLIALLSASMHGANLLLIGELPGRFAGSGHVGVLSGLLNSCVYVGAALSIYGFPVLQRHFSGWRPVFAIWAVVLALGVALIAVALRLTAHGRNGGGHVLGAEEGASGH